MVLCEGAEVGLLAKAGVGQDHPTTAEILPVVEVFADSVALLPPHMVGNFLPCLKETAAQVGFGFAVQFGGGGHGTWGVGIRAGAVI